MSLPSIITVAPESPAARAGLTVGDQIASVNGQVPRDVIEWQFLIDDADLIIEIVRDGVNHDIEVLKREGEPLGVEVSSSVFDRVRTCDNHCEFCFIYQLPKGMRRSLYLKDDDYRLSFLYGNFTTLTRFTEADLERVVLERLSPLHVSIHATDPEVRSRMLRNRRGGMSLRWLRALLDQGIEVRGQIVVCPGVNDGDVLDDTLAGIADRFPELASVAVVPLGVSQFNSEPAMRNHTQAEAERVVDIVHEWQEIFTQLVGRRMVFAADEYYLLTGRPFPPSEHYDEVDMVEDGIGMARTFASEFEGTTPHVMQTRQGFFAAVDVPANPTAYHSRQFGNAPVPVSLTPSRTAPVAILTGEFGKQVLTPLVESLERNDVRLLTVDNQYFGGNTGVTGLMTGADIARVLADQPVGHRYLLPDVCLSDDGRFLDGTTLDDLPRPVEVVPTDGEALRLALNPAA
ncbi:MAG: Fe-S oxidoreductase [Ilumatobacter coccineus]|uniref:Fe-S oxidoreductase n=1 Tax=Ilumatobacter coccineus TaxID=467094 RepID=A0A2G6K835_9ACTN|nr:MAG: Fe-S oxidoreductase [Ilumatobacter coccineus]